MKRIALVLCCMLGAGFAAHAEEPKTALKESFVDAPKEVPKYELVKEKSALKFFAIQNSAPLEGRFNEFSATVMFHPEYPELSSIDAEVNMGSVEVGNQDVASNIRLPEWLSVEAFPKARLVIKKLSKFPMSMNYYGDGELTLRDKTKPVTVNFQVTHIDDDGAVAKGYFTLQRNEFGVGQGKWEKDDVVKKEVRVDFRVYAKKVK